MITQEVLDVCPFDLDEPNIVWGSGFWANIPSLPRCFPALLSREDALAFQKKFAKYATSPMSEPISGTLDEAISYARRKGRGLVIVDSDGRIIEEYPV
jgi:hypothetical protein